MGDDEIGHLELQQESHRLVLEIWPIGELLKPRSPVLVLFQQIALFYVEVEEGGLQEVQLKDSLFEECFRNRLELRPIYLLPHQHFQ